MPRSLPMFQYYTEMGVGLPALYCEKGLKSNHFGLHILDRITICWDSICICDQTTIIVRYEIVGAVEALCTTVCYASCTCMLLPFICSWLSTSCIPQRDWLLVLGLEQSENLLLPPLKVQGTVAKGRPCLTLSICASYV